MARTRFVLLAVLLNIAICDKTVTETYTVTYTYTYTATPTTATITPFDSLQSSSGNSGNSAASDKSLLSGSSEDYTGSSGSDYSDFNERSGEFSGFNASGSSGSYLHIWQWVTLIVMCCICHAILAGCLGVAANQNNKRRRPKPRPVKEPLPPPMLEETPQAPQVVATTVTGEVMAGSQILPVASQAGFEPGKEVVIDQGHLTEEVNVIVGFGSLMLATPLKYPHGPGATVIQLHNPNLNVQAMTPQQVAAAEAGAEKVLQAAETQALLSGAPPPVGDIVNPPPGIVPGVSFEEEHGFGQPNLFGPLPPLRGLEEPSLLKGMLGPTVPTTATPITTYTSASSLLGNAVTPAFSGSYHYPMPSRPATITTGATYAAPATYAARPATYTAGATRSAYGGSYGGRSSTPYSVGGLSAAGVI